MIWHLTSTYHILKQLWCVTVTSFQHEYRNTFISLIHFLLLFVLVFSFSFFLFSHGLAISFQFEFQQKWKYQIILFDLSIVSLDIAKTDHASAFAFLSQACFWLIPQNLFSRSPESSWRFARIFDSIPRNLLEHTPEG